MSVVPHTSGAPLEGYRQKAVATSPAWSPGGWNPIPQAPRLSPTAAAPFFSLHPRRRIPARPKCSRHRQCRGIQLFIVLQHQWFAVTDEHQLLVRDKAPRAPGSPRSLLPAGRQAGLVGVDREQQGRQQREAPWLGERPSRWFRGVCKSSDSTRDDPTRERSWDLMKDLEKISVKSPGRVYLEFRGYAACGLTISQLVGSSVCSITSVRVRPRRSLPSPGDTR